jgi:hypothetical protein
MKTHLIFFTVIINLTSNIFAQHWQSIPYPEFKPYSNNAYCRSDAQGNIWTDVLTTIGIGKSLYSTARFDVANEKWTEFSQAIGNLPKDSTIERSITRKNGEFVTISPTTLYNQNSSSSWASIPLPEISSNTSQNLTIATRDLFEDKDGNIWVLRNLRFDGINVSHISRYNGNEWISWCADVPTFSYKGVNINQFRSYGRYLRIKQAPNGDIWLLGNNGFFANPDSVSKAEIGGIARWNGNEWKFWNKELGNTEKGLNDQASNFAIDNQNRLIIAQPQLKSSPDISGGVTVFDNGVYTFYRQDNGSIPADTLFGLPGQKFGNIYVNQLFVVLDIAISTNSWYINTAYHGVLEFDGTGWKAIANKINGLTNGGAGFGIAIDKNGDLWASVLGGDIARLRNTKNSTLDETNDLRLAIYPNPTSDVLYLGNKSNVSIRKIELISLLGNTLLEINESEISNTTKLDVRNLATGRYILRVTDSNGRTSTQQVGVVR